MLHFVIGKLIPIFFYFFHQIVFLFFLTPNCFVILVFTKRRVPSATESPKPKGSTPAPTPPPPPSKTWRTKTVILYNFSVPLLYVQSTLCNIYIQSKQYKQYMHNACTLYPHFLIQTKIKKNPMNEFILVLLD